VQTIHQRIKTSKGWRYKPVKTGKGVKTGDLEPPFFFRYTTKDAGAGRRHRQQWQRLPAQSFADALLEAEKFALRVEADAKGLTVAEAGKTDNLNRLTVKSAVDKYLKETASLRPKTVAAYRNTMFQFCDALTAFGIKFLDEIGTDALRSYKAFMEKLGYAGKTQDTRLATVCAMLNENKITARLTKKEKPTVEEEPAEPFTDEQLKKLFAFDGLSEKARLTFRFFLYSGCREQEVTFASWNDINFNTRTYTVRRKPDVGFSPKNHKGRTIELPPKFITELETFRETNGDSRWIFPSEEGKPDGHFLRKLKKLALRAGINCGYCRTQVTVGEYDGKKKIEVTCKTNPVCEHVYLHRFRKTCATRWLGAGLSLKKIQALLGHQLLETTDGYLGIPADPRVSEKIASIADGD